MNLELLKEGGGRIFEDPSPENRPTLEALTRKGCAATDLKV